MSAPWAVTRHGEGTVLPSDGGGTARGSTATVIAGPEQGAAHLEVAVVELEPGGSVSGHVHPFEESFYVLEGEVLVAIADRSYRLWPGDFGYAPVSTPHAWANPGSHRSRWLRTRAPQPRWVDDRRGVYPVTETAPPTGGRPVIPADRARRFVGHFDESLLPQAGPIQMKGFRSAAPTNVAVYMLVDEVMGAVHHAVFMIRFGPTGETMTLGGEHFHPFEETYYILEGEAVAHLEGEAVTVGPGDLVFAGVNAFHGFTNTTSEPVRWIEAQAPMPPPANSFFFRSDWSG